MWQGLPLGGAYRCRRCHGLHCSSHYQSAGKPALAGPPNTPGRLWRCPRAVPGSGLSIWSYGGAEAIRARPPAPPTALGAVLEAVLWPQAAPLVADRPREFGSCSSAAPVEKTAPRSELLLLADSVPRAGSLALNTARRWETAIPSGSNVFRAFAWQS